jgi:hypothetical protein
LPRAWRGAAAGLPPLPSAPIVVPIEPAAERLARLARECLTGNLAGAELGLNAWSRDADCPDTARVLLAALFTRRGKPEDARAVLHRRDATAPGADPALLQMLIANLVAADLTDAARRLVGRLYHAHGDDAAIALWLQIMEVPGAADMPALPDVRIERLAAELAARPGVIPSLVAAQHVAPIAADVAMLRSALGLAAKELDADARWMSAVCQAMAELALLADDRDDARRWAHRGLKRNPYSAALALVLGRVEDDPAVGPPAARVLRDAVAAHPQYPDLRAALIRREQVEGRRETARLHLADWLRREPDHPLAREMARKLESERAA